jgi:hypothetical protein
MKSHAGQTTITMTGHRDGANPQALERSNLIVGLMHDAIEEMGKYAEWLNVVGHNKRWVKTYTSYVFYEVDWAGQYAHRQRKVKINVMGNDIHTIIDTLIHELGHVWYMNAEKLGVGMQVEDFKQAILADLGSIDSYSRSRKLKNAMKRRTSLFVNEIHSILTEMKYGTNKLQRELASENMTEDETKRLKRFIPIYNELHPETAKNPEWLRLARITDSMAGMIYGKS